MDKRYYRSYLVRLWRDEGDDHAVWRGSIEDPHTGVRVGFADLARLCEFLRQQTAAAARNPDEASLMQE